MLIKFDKSIFNDQFRNILPQITYVDIGARGDVFSPWKELDGDIKIVGFEPDPVECDRLKSKFKNRIYFPNALWSTETNRIVNINVVESTSSMFKANSNLNHIYNEIHTSPRVTVKEVYVDCTTLDLILTKHDICPSYIKIDTQGAELDILKGSINLLNKFTPLVSCETWIEEVYLGAPLIDEIIAFMRENGYQVFDFQEAASWRFKNKKNVKTRNKLKLNGAELLFIKKMNSTADIKNESLKLPFLLLLELWGFRDYAINLIENNLTPSLEESQLLNCFYRNAKIENSFIFRFLGKMGIVFGVRKYPSLR